VKRTVFDVGRYPQVVRHWFRAIRQTVSVIRTAICVIDVSGERRQAFGIMQCRQRTNESQ